MMFNRPWPRKLSHACLPEPWYDLDQFDWSAAASERPEAPTSKSADADLICSQDAANASEPPVIADSAAASSAKSRDAKTPALGYDAR